MTRTPPPPSSPRRIGSPPASRSPPSSADGRDQSARPTRRSSRSPPPIRARHPTWPRRWTTRPRPAARAGDRGPAGRRTSGSRRLPLLPSSAAAPPARPRRQRRANRGEVLLSEAKELYKNGNYQAAKQLANEAKAGKFGVEAQADELIAQIALAEQGGALSLYEAALAALRTGDNGRARALLTEVAAAGDSLDDSMRAKVENLLQKLSADEKGKTDGKSGTNAAQDAEALAAQKLNAEVGTKIAEGRRLHETDPDKAIAIYEKTVQAVQASGLSPDLTRPMVRRLEVAIELATKDKVAFEAKMQDKQLRAEIEMKRLRILEADKAKKVRMKELMDKATTAYAEGNYVECEAFAKRAMEVDPNELAASMLVFKAKTERRFKQDLQNRNDKEEGVVHGVPGSRHGGDRRSGSPDPGHQVRQELQGPDQGSAGDERQARAQERPEGHGDRGEAQRPHLDQHGQAALERGGHVPHELHRSEHRARSQGTRRRGIVIGVAREPGRQQRQAQDAS